MKYKYTGRGERLVRAEDFESLGVEHSDVYFTEGNGFSQELSEEAAQALIGHGEPLVPEAEPEDDGGEPADEAETPKTRTRNRRT